MTKFACFWQPDIEPGDVIIILQQKEHELFTRNDNDLYCTNNLSLTEALCGFQFTLKHLDGRDLVINSPPGVVTSPGNSKLWLLEINKHDGDSSSTFAQKHFCINLKFKKKDEKIEFLNLFF